MKIKAYTGYGERNHTHYYNTFEVVDKLPEIGEVVYGSEGHGERKVVTAINDAWLDCEQSSLDVYNYDYYVIDVKWQDLNDDGEWVENKEWQDVLYYAMKKQED